MPSDNQSTTSWQTANTSEHTVSTESRTKSEKTKRKKRKRQKSEENKINCIFFCCCYLMPQKNGRNP